MKIKQPDWMKDEIVKDIPQEKLAFLNSLFLESKSMSGQAKISFLMSMLKEAKQKQLSLSKEEMNSAMQAIRKYSTPEELNQIDNLLKKSKKGSL